MRTKESSDSCTSMSVNASFCAVLMCLVGCASAAAPKPDSIPTVQKVTEKPPGIGAGFPSAESFYPPEAKKLFREGLVVVRYCVDPQGNLQEAPTLAKSSGSPDLDSAGLLLATAGDGHYLPAQRNGVAVSACGQFGVRFKIAEDPRWPSLAKRENSIGARLSRGSLDLRAAELAAAPKSLELYSSADLVSLQKYASLLDDTRAKRAALMEEYISGMDDLAQVPTVPAAEHDAFQIYWAQGREATIRYSHELDEEEQEFIKAITQTVDYYTQAKPPLLTASGTRVPAPTRAQQERLRQLAESRTAAAVRMQATTDAFARQTAVKRPPSVTGALPRVDADFPAPESFYPADSRDLLREGLVVVRFCVDANGKLLDAPTVAKSSGSPDLDSAGILLATMGNGHYIAGRRDGAAVAGCNELGVRFQLPEDPRWPSLSKRERSLSGRLAQGSDALAADMRKASLQGGLDLRSWEDLAAFRQYARIADDARAKQVAMQEEYVKGMDDLAKSASAPKDELSAFRAYWTARRAATIRYTHEIDVGLQEAIRLMTKLANYYERASPPLLTASGTATPTPTSAQQSALRRIAGEGAAAEARVQATMDRFSSEESAKEASEAPASP